MIMEEIRKRHDITMADVSGIRADVEDLRERHREGREDQKAENAAVNRKVGAMGERLARLEAGFVAFRGAVVSRGPPAGEAAG